GVEIFQYNAFTDLPFAGHPAGVVTDASGLEDTAMQRIARQLNLAETAFLLPPSTADADVRLRWFTPAQEVTLCGHATIAAFSAAAERGVFPVTADEERILQVETLSGILRIRVRLRDGVPEVAMQIPVPSFDALEIDRGAFAALWGVGEDALAGEWLVHRALSYWYMPVRDRAALGALTLRTDKLAAIGPKAAFAFFTRDTVEPDSHWHLRFFAPFHGVPEDIVTGSAQGPMGVIYLGLTGGETDQGWSEFKGEQGDLLGRPGRVRVRVYQQRGAVSDLEIAGGAVAMLEGRIRI
ncbi:MAG: PhzF family phenazine biosynthesis protein, partial [Gemmatimonadota bacterium]